MNTPRINPTAARIARDAIREILAPKSGFILLDTETTASDESAEIIELGMIRASTGRVIYHQHFEPRRPSSPGAQAVHQIDPADLQGQPRFAACIPGILAALDDMPVCCWGAGFDYRMLQQEFARAGQPWEQSSWLCASTLHHLATTGNSRKTMGLTDACESLRIPVRDAHSALGDVRMIRAVLQATLQAKPKPGPKDCTDRHPETAPCHD